MQRSMAQSPDENLRIELTAQFNSLIHGITDAAEISRVLLPLANGEAASYILSGLLRRWNGSHCVTRHLPPEMLAGSFTFLPFRARVWASHVSSSWRSASLGNPSVWSNIELRGKLRNEAALLRMALSRTGQRPVDLLYAWNSRPDADGVVATCLAEHMHHFRTIDWYPHHSIVPFTLAAPLLVEFTADDYNLEIPEDFLGGRTSRLRKLHFTPCQHYMHLPHRSTSTRLPSTCPALATVTSLSLHLPESPEYSSSFSRLFQLCPLLESLSLCGLDHPHGDALPTDPAPRTLQFLSLQSSSPDYNVAQHYVAWSPGTALSDIRIDLDSEPGPDFDIASLFAGAESLDLMLDWRGGRVLLIAHPPHRSLSFDDDGEGAWAGAELVLRARADALRKLFIPSQALAPFLEMGALRVCPDLQHLSLVVEAEPRDRYDWTTLGKLAEAEAVCPQLESVTIIVRQMESSKKGEDFAPLDAETARALLAALTELDPAPRTPIRVFGFPQRALDDLPVVEGPGVRVNFEASKHL